MHTCLKAGTLSLSDVVFVTSGAPAPRDSASPHPFGYWLEPGPQSQVLAPGTGLSPPRLSCSCSTLPGKEPRRNCLQTKPTVSTAME